MRVSCTKTDLISCNIVDCICIDISGVQEPKSNQSRICRSECCRTIGSRGSDGWMGQNTPRPAAASTRLLCRSFTLNRAL